MFLGDDYLNPPKILWICVTSCKTLDSEEALLFAAVKKEFQGKNEGLPVD